MKTIVLLAATVLPACWAADDFKPLDIKLGLWETTAKTEMGGRPSAGSMPQIPEETLAKMPPAQRAQVEARMKSAGAPRTTTTKTCITQESLRSGAQFGQNDNSCTYKVVSSSSSHELLHTECSRGDVKMSGDFSVDRLDSEHVKGSMTMKSAAASMPVNVKMTFDTKWVASDCGGVTPFVLK